jgi:RND family efflux transporter MFP subunit
MNVSLKSLPQLARRRLKYIVILFVVTTVIGFLSLRPVSVVRYTVARGPVTVEVMGTGTLAARVKVALSPKIQGRLGEVLVDQNDKVRAGQLLARLDDGELQQQVEIARAALAFARATADRVRADQDRAEAVAKLTSLDHQRSTELLATKAMAQADYDKSLQSLRVAEADLRRSQFAITETERQIATAEKTLLYQQERLGDTRLLSPFDGLVVKRHRDAGEVVVPGSAILEIVSTDEIWVAAWVDETAMAGLKAGQPARIIFRSEPDKPYVGEVARLGRQTDPETREFLVEVRLIALPANWTIGQRAEVYITTQKKTALATVPPSFLAVHDGQSGVFVSEGGKARWRPVRLGLRGPDAVEIVEGLVAGEQLVMAGGSHADLKDGARVAAP